MLSNFLIGLREGLEAALVVSILVAYLVKSDRRHQLRWIWTGVAVAVLLPVGATLLLGAQSRKLDFRSTELLGGVLSLVAAAFVTFMVFWMAGAARSIAGELRGRLDAAADRPFALALVSFLAVGREGMETAAILWANTQTATGRDQAPGTELTSTPLIGALLGIATAVVIGFLLYRGAISINLTVFFTWTGAFLVFVAAGVLSYGVHDLQEIGVLPGLNSHAWDISGWYDPSSWYGAILAGMLNLTARPSVLEVLVWWAYVVPVMTLFLLAARRRRAPRPAPSSTTQEVTS
ncbi:iron uptake transporter permease EfeU [Nocardioides sp. R-C-SC26]|uniref:iron uptake transporter permease EfeU n=1 Tax=Nocardioides sp. R-C-SC26 TaxID=2870414 RepID=UPI001E5CC444|nr:iron uptake transporter permease EfeU [Nocardioides sp. R-C-SC26]